MEDQRGESSGSHNAVDTIASWAEELRKKQERAVLRLGGGSPPPCTISIGMVSHLTRNVDPTEYNPHHVSIGPYHRTKHPYLARDDEKLICFRAVLSAARPNITEEVYLDEMAHLESRARSCYADPVKMERKEFVNMLLLDACYVLDRFSRRNGASAANGQVEGGYHTSSTALVSAPAEDGAYSLENAKVVRDVLYLAENQIPFFVVEKVHELTTGESGTAVDAIVVYVRELLQMRQYSVAAPPLPASEVGNLLHLLHMHLKPVPSSATGDGAIPTGERVGRWRSATDYHFAGVRFKSRPVGANEAQCILDVKLDSGGGTLQVPRLNLDAQTLGLLRNLMEMEQRNPAKGSHVTAYCVFMWQVACTPSDVVFLSRRGIIVHSLGNHGEVAKYFSDLCKGILFKLEDPRRNYLSATCEALEKRFRSRPRRWMAWLRQKYFSNPWLTTGLLAAALVLFCTVVQAVYSFMSYKQGANQKS